MEILAVYLWRYWLPLCGDLGWLLTASSWRTTVSLLRTSVFERFLTLRLGFLSFSHRGIVMTFSFSSKLRNVFAVFWTYPLVLIYIDGANVTVRIFFGVTIRISWFKETCCDISSSSPSFFASLCNLHRSNSFLSLFLLPKSLLDFYFILFYKWLVLADVTIGVPCRSSSWRNCFIDRVLWPIFPLLLFHCVSG